jgi:hypothetical protein
MKKTILVTFVIFTLIKGMAQSNYAIELDGVNDYVSSSVDIYNNSNMVQGTMAIWFKTSNTYTNETQIVSYEGYTSLSMDALGLVGACSDGICTSAKSTTPYNDGKWHFAVLTWNSSIETNLYIDGTFIAQVTPTQAPKPNTTTNRALVLGYHPAFPTNGFDYFKGSVDELSIWTKKFSASGVVSLMDSCLTGLETDLLGYWKLEAGTGTAESDLTAGGNNLTLNGGTWVTPGAAVCCNIDTSVLQTNNILSANATGVSYQWVDCNNGFSAIAGDTNKTFTASGNGSYAVIITNGSCKDTSACHQVLGLNVYEYSKTSINIFPNPTKGLFNVKRENGETINYIITSLDGKVIQERSNVSAEQFSIDLGENCKGTYLLKIESEKSFNIFKITKL